MLAPSTRTCGFPTTGTPGTATASATGSTWHGITYELFVQAFLVWTGSSDIINKNPSDLTNQKIRPRLFFRQIKRPRLTFRKKAQASSSDLIDQKNVRSYSFEKKPQAYSCDNIRPIFRLILFTWTVNLSELSELTATSSNMGMINQVNTTIASRLARKSRLFSVK